MVELFRIGFLSVTAVDILDIAVVSLLFYALYRVLKDTVAVQILLGFVLILAFSVITQSLNLKALNWILRAISDIWLIAFIILFQPEIRRVLLLITRTRLFRLFVRRNFSETIDEVIEAVHELSDRHMGALIVFPRTQNIKMTIDTGISLQALVTRELLVSIFNPKSPLHDGAVIIENQIITAARCVLPLSVITKIDSGNLGTRHRAGLGISEQSDSIVLIVSEETGAISLAREGNLIHNISIELLPNLLQSHLTSRSYSELQSSL